MTSKRNQSGIGKTRSIAIGLLALGCASYLGLGQSLARVPERSHEALASGITLPKSCALPEWKRYFCQTVDSRLKEKGIVPSVTCQKTPDQAPDLEGELVIVGATPRFAETCLPEMEKTADEAQAQLRQTGCGNAQIETSLSVWRNAMALGLARGTACR